MLIFHPMKDRVYREERITITFNGAPVTKSVHRDELVITSRDGTAVAIDVEDPFNQEVLESIGDAEENREAAENKRHDRRLKAFAYSGIATLGAFVILAAANIYSMGGDNERAKPSGDPIEQAGQNTDAEQIEFSDLTIYGENDVWNYIEHYAAIKQLSAIQVYGIVTKANPGVNFHKIQQGEKIKVPTI